MRCAVGACLALVIGALALACGSDDDEGSSGSGGGSGTGGVAGGAGASGAGGTGGTGATGGTGGASGSAGTAGAAGEAGAGGQAGEAGAAGAAGAGGNTASLSVTIVDLVQEQPVEGIDVCVHEAQPENCETTDGTGQVVLQVPEGEDIVITYGTTDPDFRTHALAIGADAIAAGTTVNTGALSETMASFLFSQVGITDDPAKGHVVGLAVQTAGATAAIDPESGQGPIYTDASGQPDTSLTETTTSGAFLFVNVDPGTVEVSVDYPGGSCTHEMGHEGSADNATPVPVVGGWFTVVSAFDCVGGV